MRHEGRLAVSERTPYSVRYRERRPATSIRLFGIILGMPERLGWTRDQLLLALRLYMRMPFGRLHGRNPEIIELAEKIGRTSNALAMKACNFASLDPALRLTDRRGLSGSSA